MKLAHLFHERRALPLVEVADKHAALEQLVTASLDGVEGVKPKDALAEAIKREEQVSTAIGHGVATPHAKLANLPEPLVGVMTLKEPVVWDEVTGEKAHIVFLALTASGQNTQMLQTLASIARLCNSKETREALAGIRSGSRLIKLVEESGLEVKQSITAADVMHRDFTPIDPNWSLREAVTAMSRVESDDFPVVNGDGAPLGAISSSDLMKIGVAPYIDLLTDDSFLSNFEPFEQYYKQENTRTVRETMSEETVLVSPDTPIIKVAHQLVQRGQRRAFVVKEKKLVGLVYSKDILSRILNL